MSSAKSHTEYPLDVRRLRGLRGLVQSLGSVMPRLPGFAEFCEAARLGIGCFRSLREPCDGGRGGAEFAERVEEQGAEPPHGPRFVFGLIDDLGVPLGHFLGCGVLGAEVELRQGLGDGWPQQLTGIPDAHVSHLACLTVVTSRLWQSLGYDAPVAVVSARGGHRSLVGMLLAFLQARLAAKGRPGRFAALAAKARQHVVTAAALASVDIGAFHIGPAAGWIVMGLSLLALDFAVTG